MLFPQRFRAGVEAGDVTLTFRRWKRSQVVAGRRYRTGVGILHVDDVHVVEASTLTADDARQAGFPDVASLLAQIPGEPSAALHRVAFHLVREPDPRTVLASDAALDEDARAEIDRRLDRLDRSSACGPWTRQTLRLIAANPARRAGDLAAMVGRDRESFKIDVRKLKNLGMTVSLEVGYRLSPRGAAYLGDGS